MTPKPKLHKQCKSTSKKKKFHHHLKSKRKNKGNWKNKDNLNETLLSHYISCVYLTYYIYDILYMMLMYISNKSKTTKSIFQSIQFFIFIPQFHPLLFWLTIDLNTGCDFFRTSLGIFTFFEPFNKLAF
jgi:hypothetical protein